MTLHVDDTELQQRRHAWTPPENPYTSGYTWLYTHHVQQADTGADFDFLHGTRGHTIPRDSH